jgi:DNA invertase Pin-like site-specific DNA recombinase
LRAACYARVSTHDQNPERQVGNLKEFCLTRGWEPTVIIDRISGAASSRPGMDEMMKLCRRRRVGAVVVERYDRFARSVRQLVEAAELFSSLGIEFVSLREGVNTSTPNGRLVFGIFASIAEFERSLISERVSSGMRAARSRGVYIGRPKVTVDPVRIRLAVADGKNWSQIGRDLGISSRTARRLAQESV